MNPPRTRRLPIEIPLPSKPKSYRSGDGPALAPIRLALENDSGAFIIDKRVILGKSSHGEPKAELYYIVGWPELPAAAVTVLATKILDYVSPRTLEDWEYDYSLEKDEVRREQEALEQRLGQQKHPKTGKVPKPTTVTDADTGVRVGTGANALAPSIVKPKRPSKAELLARQLAEQATFEDEELPNVPLPPASTKGPSLSTPQKRLAQLAKDAGDLEETDTNTTIPEYVCGDSDDDNDDDDDDIEFQAADGFDRSNEPRNSLDFTSLSSFHPVPSFRGHAQFRSLNTPSSLHRDPTPSTSIQVTLHSTSKKKPSRQTLPLATPASAPSRLDRPRKRASKPPAKVSPVSPPSYVPSRPRAVKQTPVPVPQYPAPKQRPVPSRKPGPARIRAAASPTPKSETSHKTTFTPVSVAPYPRLQERSKKPGLSKKSQRVSNTAIPPSESLPNGTKESVELTRFTPIHHGGGTGPGGAASGTKHNGQTHARSNSATPTAKAGSSRKRKRRQSEPEPEWAVKRLEGDRVIETGGELVRFFKVRWEGNWPADQNPSWEPEELIGQDIVRKYLKNKAAKMTKGGSPAARMSQPTPTMERKYANVAEAFAGDLDDD
ncbi:hypothetical protein F4861DRAFT_526909 [Xylaria intraflava]|nr:hypothetical protein F4861DRAFT_526909 [Xylaria intraflava]